MIEQGKEKEAECLPDFSDIFPQKKAGRDLPSGSYKRKQKRSRYLL